MLKFLSQCSPLALCVFAVRVLQFGWFIDLPIEFCEVPFTRVVCMDVQGMVEAGRPREARLAQGIQLEAQGPMMCPGRLREAQGHHWEPRAPLEGPGQLGYPGRPKLVCQAV